jgi:hypothetical protein
MPSFIDSSMVCKEVTLQTIEYQRKAGNKIRRSRKINIWRGIVPPCLNPVEKKESRASISSIPLKKLKYSHSLTKKLLKISKG